MVREWHHLLFSTLSTGESWGFVLVLTPDCCLSHSGVLQNPLVSWRHQAHLYPTSRPVVASFSESTEGTGTWGIVLNTPSSQELFWLFCPTSSPVMAPCEGLLDIDYHDQQLDVANSMGAWIQSCFWSCCVLMSCPESKAAVLLCLASPIALPQCPAPHPAVCLSSDYSCCRKLIYLERDKLFCSWSSLGSQVTCHLSMSGFATRP